MEALFGIPIRRIAFAASPLLPQEVQVMKKRWIKPAMCQVPAGMEISRYQSAELARRK